MRPAPVLRRPVLAVLAVGVLAAATAASTTGVALATSATSAAADTSWLPATPPGWNTVVDHTVGRSVTITRGVTQHHETYDAVDGRQSVSFLDVNTADANVRLGAVESHDVVRDPHDETTSSMANRTGAVAGVNGGYFAINATGEPLGGTVRDGVIIKSPRPNFESQLSVLPDGRVVMGQQTYTGTVHDGSASYAVTSVNTLGDAAAGGLTHITNTLGASGTIPAATLVVGTVSGTTLHVTGVTASVTSVPALPSGEAGFVGGGAGGSWLSSTVRVGDTLSINEGLSPNSDLRQLISGVDVLIKDGKAYSDPTGTPPSDHGVHPETIIGVSRDGHHVMMVAVDGEAGEGVAEGVTATQATGLLLAHGAWSAELFDGGGSTTMVARSPGATRASVVNVPSDDQGERPVANGLFVYSTERRAGAARTVVVNGNQPLTVLAGSTVHVASYARDAVDNPAAQPPILQVAPRDLAQVDSTGRLHALRAGDGLLVATAGSARSVVPLHVVSQLRTLSISPTTVDLVNGASQTFSLKATGSSLPIGPASTVTLPNTAAHWSVSPSSLGTVTSAGVFTASATGVGLATVTATAGGRTAGASVAVGRESTVIAPFDDASQWNLRNTTGRPATLTTVPGAVPPGSTEKAGTQLTYSLPGNSGVKQLVLSTKGDDPVAPIKDGKSPDAIALWVHGDGSGIDTAFNLNDATGKSETVYPTFVTWTDWQLLVVPIPADLKAPIDIGFIDFLGINPTHDLSGTLQLSDLQALYSPRPVVPPTYVAIPDNPSWLRYTEDPATFPRGGATTLFGDDAHLLASDQESAAHHVLATIAARLPQLPAAARPQTVQMLGDMPDDGALVDLTEARDVIASLGLPYRDAVGNHEITQGQDPENKNFTAVFGDTHYAYSLQHGAADVVVTDNAHGGILSSDPYQVPAQAQYPWLVQQLSGATARTVLVVTHMPAYDPHLAADSQFSDRWEAREYVRLVQRYQQTHPAKHVVMLYGHSRGFAEQMIDPDGRPADAAHGGIPQLTFADLGMPPYAPGDQGGFYHYGLVHTGADGSVQFAVQPVLSSIVVAPVASVAVGAHVTAAATGTMVGGDNEPVRTMPIADPASHVWTSSDPRVASVDARTGVVTGRHRGTATITVTSGQVSGSVSVTVR